MSSAINLTGPRKGKVYVDLPAQRHATNLPKNAPAIPKRRFSHVYVEMPPLSARAKENRPAPSAEETLSYGVQTQKRKRTNSASATDAIIQDANKVLKGGLDRPVKKLRASDVALVVSSKTSHVADIDGTRDPGRCHQCHRVWDGEAILQCTIVGARSRRCGIKYCRRCLGTRYDMDLDAIRTPPSPTKTSEGHILAANYIFSCPKCQGKCLCCICRKSKGVEGQLVSRSPSKTLTAAVDELDLLPHRQSSTLSESSSGSKIPSTKDGSQPGSFQVSSITKPAPKMRKTAISQTASRLVQGRPAATGSTTAPIQLVRSALPRPLPVLKWKSLPISNTFDEQTAAARINIREFVLRFFELFDLTKPRLRELDDIVGKAITVDEEAVEGCITSSWVGEVCLREIVAGLLATIGEEATGPEKKAIEIALKNIRNSGANLMKMWSALCNLGDILRSCGSTLPQLPEPLPAPRSLGIHNTRHATKTDGVHVAYTAQLVPVIAALIDAALTTKAVREILDAGVEEIKERQKDAREAIKREKEKWDSQGGGKGKTKVIRQAHKQQLAGIDNAIEVIAMSYTTRCSPVGTDLAGRVYWILSPGQAEREAAQNILETPKENKGVSARRSARGTRIFSAPDIEQRSSMEDWTWIVAIWGSRPVAPSNGSRNSSTSDSLHEDQWWGFWEPKEIANLAEWLDITHGTSKRIAKSNSSISLLVSALRKHSELLAWRCREMEQVEPANRKAATETLEATKFYA